MVNTQSQIENPADGANNQWGKEKDLMQDPSVVKIPDNQTPVEPPAAPKAKFPLPDHECARQGFVCPYSGEWDNVESFDLGQRIIWNAIERTSNPLSLFQMYLSNKLLAFAEAYLPADVYQEFYWHWRIGDDLELSLNNLTSKVPWYLPTCPAASPPSTRPYRQRW